ncbi:MAG: response regulator [Nitrospirota bacterium]
MAGIAVAVAPEKFRETLCGALRAYGHEVVTADTADQAVRLLDGPAPALLLVDLSLPGRPGLETLATLRARAPQVPLLVVAERLAPDMDSRIRRLGITEVLRKGLKLDDLMHLITRALQQVGKQAGRPSLGSRHLGPEGGSAPKAATILIVDDEPEIAALMGEFLASRGYRIRTASNGPDALALIRRDPPDLVLLDLYMPGMNGVEVLRRLKAPTAPADSLNAIVVTASQDEPLLQEALDLGAFDVLHKPVDLHQVELAVMVKLLLGAEP